eukprot:12907326-Prorocentrum_lima.AAC.1
MAPLPCELNAELLRFRMVGNEVVVANQFHRPAEHVIQGLLRVARPCPNEASLAEAEGEASGTP